MSKHRRTRFDSRPGSRAVVFRRRPRLAERPDTNQGRRRGEVAFCIGCGADVVGKFHRCPHCHGPLA